MSYHFGKATGNSGELGGVGGGDGVMGGKRGCLQKMYHKLWLLSAFHY